MSSLRRFSMLDTLRFNRVNLDPFTETFNLPYYMQYLCRWPNLFVVSETRGRVSGYVMGKVEGERENWHGHVTAITVAPEYRRLGLANRFMELLEHVSDASKCYFVDLFVRCSNALAIGMYKKLGYVEYRRIREYYSGEEDAFDMRKSLSLDPAKNSMRPHEPFLVNSDDPS